MAKQSKVKIVSISIAPGTFSYIFKRFKGEKSEFEFSDLEGLRKVLSNEKAKILYTVKHENPKSIYHLSKILKRDFKSVIDEVKILERFGFIELKKEAKGKRKMFRPVLAVDSLQVNFQI